IVAPYGRDLKLHLLNSKELERSCRSQLGASSRRRWLAAAGDIWLAGVPRSGSHLFGNRVFVNGGQVARRSNGNENAFLDSKFESPPLNAIRHKACQPDKECQCVTHGHQKNALAT